MISQVNHVVLLTALVAAIGCTRTPRQLETGAPTPERAAEPGPGEGTETQRSTQRGSGGSEVGVSLDEGVIRAKYRVDTNNLEYTFRYLDFEDSNKISFEEGKAQLTFKGLEAGKTGEMVLELSEDGIVKLRAAKADVTLVTGEENRIALVLEEVDGDTDVVIDVTLDGSDESGEEGGTTGDGDEGGTEGDGGSEEGGSTDPLNPDDDLRGELPPEGEIEEGELEPLDAWDGLSFRGNSRWELLPAN